MKQYVLGFNTDCNYLLIFNYIKTYVPIPYVYLLPFNLIF